MLNLTSRPRITQGKLQRQTAAVVLATVCLATMATGQTPQLATSPIYTGYVGATWNHTFVWPRGIARITTTGTNGLDLDFRPKLTSVAGRTTEKTVCKRQIDDPAVRRLGGTAPEDGWPQIWTFEDYDPENGGNCDPSERLKKTVARPDTGPKNCRRNEPNLLDCSNLNTVDLPDEVSYTVNFPDNTFANRVVTLNFVFTGGVRRQIRYVAGGCNWLTCP